MSLPEQIFVLTFNPYRPDDILEAKIKTYVPKSEDADCWIIEGNQKLAKNSRNVFLTEKELADAINGYRSQQILQCELEIDKIKKMTGLPIDICKELLINTK